MLICDKYNLETDEELHFAILKLIVPSKKNYYFLYSKMKQS